MFLVVCDLLTANSVGDFVFGLLLLLIICYCDLLVFVILLFGCVVVSWFGVSVVCAACIGCLILVASKRRLVGFRF